MTNTDGEAKGLTVADLVRAKEILDAAPAERWTVVPFPTRLQGMRATCIIHDEIHYSNAQEAVSYDVDTVRSMPRDAPRPRRKRVARPVMGPEHMALMRSVRFSGVKVGIEFTTIPPSLMDGKRDHDMAAEMVVNEVREAIGRTQLVEKVHDDPGVVEISSAILRDWGSVTSFYKLARDATDKHKCKPDSPYQIGGGGHIHISAKDWPTTGRCAPEADPTAVKIHNWCYERPWVCWAFNDPSDNDTAVLRHTSWDNSSAINDRWDNIEFRFFDAAVSVEEQVEHVAFALKLLRLGCSLPDKEVLQKNEGCLPKLTLQQALAGWKTTVEQLGLPWNLYKRYSRNIRERYQLGPRYLN